MRYAEAFEKLGYRLDSPRQDWTAEKEDGVCMTLWQKLTKFEGGLPFCDSRIHDVDISEWGNKPGNWKRMRHLKRALAEFDGLVDVIIVNGDPGVGYGDAEPWIPEQRRGAFWKVTYLDETTGHFRVEAILPG